MIHKDYELEELEEIDKENRVFLSYKENRVFNDEQLKMIETLKEEEIVCVGAGCNDFFIQTPSSYEANGNYCKECTSKSAKSIKHKHKKHV